MAEHEGIDVKTLIIEESTLGDVFKLALRASKIIVTAFNAEMALTLVSLRTRLFIDSPIVFYLHGFASVACWPMKHWGLLDIWNKHDIFISSAKRDLAQFSLSIKTSNSFVVPFALTDQIKIDESQNLSHQHLSLYYVGRISEQKNIHSLLWALSIHLYKTKNENISLDVFGSEDNLGSPNMGKNSGPYLDKLIQITNDLGLNHIVKYHGFVERNEISYRIRDGKKIFITASLHSDENFGMAALRALTMGHLAILSDWGGHSDFLENFREAVHLVNVEVSDTGPFLNIADLVNHLKVVSDELRSPSLRRVSDYYQLSNIRKDLNKIFNSNTASDFKFSEIIEILSKRWVEYKDNNHSSRVFSSYEDIFFHQFCMAYANRNQYYTNPNRGRYVAAPWVEIFENKLVIDDPHRGIKEIILASETLRSAWLIEHGYAFFINDFESPR